MHPSEDAAGPEDGEVRIVRAYPQRAGALVELRSTEWDGPPPLSGDLLTTRGGAWYEVVSTAAGAGMGQWTIRARRLGTDRPRIADEANRAIYRWASARSQGGDE